MEFSSLLAILRDEISDWTNYGKEKLKMWGMFFSILLGKVFQGSYARNGICIIVMCTCNSDSKGIISSIIGRP